MKPMLSRACYLLLAAAPLFAQSASFQWIRAIGGSGGAAVVGVATDAQGNVYAAGNTTSGDMPVTGAVQAHPGGSGLFRIDGSAWTNLSNSRAISVNWLSVSGQNPKLVLAACQLGIIRTTDGGATWTLVLPVQSPPVTVAFDPSNDSLAYAAGGGWNFNSTDGGVTWGGIHSGSLAPATELVWVDPNPPHAVFVATSGTLWRSPDGGRTPWQQSASFAVLSLAFDPFTPGTIYAGNYGTLQVSKDDGLTWGLLTSPDPVYGAPYLIADPLHAGVLYASSYSGIYRSADSGASWTKVQSYSSSGTMAADPATGAIYIAEGGNVYVTTDQFATLRQTGPAFTAPVQALAVAGSSVFEGVGASDDAFVVKYDSSGNIVYSTYFGGSGQDEARGMAIDANGAVYVMGIAYSADLPVTAGSYSNTGNGFLFKLNPDGSLAYSTRFSLGSGGLPSAIAVDSSGHAFVAGTTQGGLPVTEGAYQTVLQGQTQPTWSLAPIFPPTNWFLMKFAPAGESLVFSTYLGSQGAVADAVALEPDASAVVSGAGTLWRIDPSGSTLLASATIPPSISTLATDTSGNVYAAGGTGGRNVSATGGGFYSVTGPATTSGHVFVSKFDSQLDLQTTAIFGGESGDLAQGITIGSGGNVIVVGSTYSQGFPTRGEAQSSFSNSTGFVTELTADLSSLTTSTYAGDTRMFNALAAAPAANGGIVFAGSTQAPSYANDGSGLGSFDGDLPSGISTQAYVVSTAIGAAGGPRIDSVVSAADHLALPLSASATFTITGAGFGSGTSVTLDGRAVPLLAQSATSLTFAVPADFTSNGTVTVTAQSAGGAATTIAPFAATAPAVFSVDGSGFGQGFILNSDGTVNSPSNPALEGSKVTIFATGVGALTFNQGYAVTASSVAVTIDGFWANGIAATFAPVAGLPGNVYQVSVYVPQPSLLASQNSNLSGFHLPPQSPVVLNIGGAKSQTGLTISVTH